MVTKDGHGTSGDASVGVEIVERALRRVRPSVYRISGAAERITITLTVAVSAAGRRNAAMRIVSALADGGLAVVADDPVGELARGTSLVVTKQPRLAP